jgi:hypothetical protein
MRGLVLAGSQPRIPPDHSVADVNRFASFAESPQVDPKPCNRTLPAALRAIARPRREQCLFCPVRDPATGLAVAQSC